MAIALFTLLPLTFYRVCAIIRIGYEKAKELAKDPVYANYASMKIDEIEMLDKLFPEFRAMPRNYDIHTLIEKAVDIVING